MAFVSLGASLPEVEVCVDFNNDPTSSTRTWTDITPYVRRFSIRRGRESERARAEPGTLALTLDNRDRRFDPTYTSGPYYPNVLVMRRVRVRAQWASVVYNLFHGYIEEWPPTWPDDGLNALVDVVAVDAFKVLNLYEINGLVFGTARSDIRLGSVFAAAGFGTTDYSLATGQSTMGSAGTITGVSVLSHAQEVVESESGVLFVNGGGTTIFQDRHWRLLNASAPSGTIGDAGGEIRYDDLVANYDDRELWNVVRITPAGGTAEGATDTSSTARYYTRVLSRGVLITSQSEANDNANYLLARYAEPSLRIDEAQVVGAADTTTWPLILAAEISNRYLVKRRPPGGGTIEINQHLERVSIDADLERNWRTRWRMSPADNQSYWVLGDPALSLLGETTRLAY